MAYELSCNGINRIKLEKLQVWLKENNRIKIECTKKGISITNVCCKNLRVKSNGSGLKIIRKGKTTGLLTQGENVFIEGKTFIVQKVALK